MRTELRYVDYDTGETLLIRSEDRIPQVNSTMDVNGGAWLVQNVQMNSSWSPQIAVVVIRLSS